MGEGGLTCAKISPKWTTAENLAGNAEEDVCMGQYLKRGDIQLTVHAMGVFIQHFVF